jgi:hypothetical protein
MRTSVAVLVQASHPTPSRLIPPHRIPTHHNPPTTTQLTVRMWQGDVLRSAILELAAASPNFPLCAPPPAPAPAPPPPPAPLPSPPLPSLPSPLLSSPPLKPSRVRPRALSAVLRRLAGRAPAGIRARSPRRPRRQNARRRPPPRRQKSSGCCTRQRSSGCAPLVTRRRPWERRRPERSR